MSYLLSIPMLIVVLLSTACAPMMEKQISEFDRLPSSIGDTTVRHEPPFDLPVAFNEGLAEKTEYGEKTDKWFETGISMSAGKALPGEEVFFRLDRRSGGLTFRYRLTERNAALENIGVIKEEVTSSASFSADLPDKEGALYLLSAEALNENGEVEDTLLSLIEVPTQSVNARLYTDKEVYRGRDEMTLHLENFGPTALSFGTEYTIERFENDEWHTLRSNQVFPAIGLAAKPGDIYKDTIRLPDLPAGDYRIVKQMRGDGTEIEAALAAYFQVSD